jgi:hypothetical protein
MLSRYRSGLDRGRNDPSTAGAPETPDTPNQGAEE